MHNIRQGIQRHKTILFLFDVLFVKCLFNKILSISTSGSDPKLEFLLVEYDNDELKSNCHEDISAYLYFYAFLFISQNFSAILCILHFIFEGNFTERTVFLWAPLFFYKIGFGKKVFFFSINEKVIREMEML